MRCERAFRVNEIADHNLASSSHVGDSADEAPEYTYILALHVAVVIDPHKLRADYISHLAVPINH